VKHWRTRVRFPAPPQHNAVGVESAGSLADPTPPGVMYTGTKKPLGQELPPGSESLHDFLWAVRELLAEVRAVRALTPGSRGVYPVLAGRVFDLAVAGEPAQPVGLRRVDVGAGT
jgi:hypothetical protein